MTDHAFVLAAMRAGLSHRVSPQARVRTEAAATAIGRSVVEVGEESGAALFALGFADGFEPNPIDTVYSVRRLSPIPLVAFACCLGMCWPGADEPLYPGRVVTVEDVVALAVELGASPSHILGALRNDLALAGLVILDGHSLRLGPAFAAWPDAQIAAFRRLADALPRPGSRV